MAPSEDEDEPTVVLRVELGLGGRRSEVQGRATIAMCPSSVIAPPGGAMRRKLCSPIMFQPLNSSSLACRSLSGAAGWGHQGHFMDYMLLNALLLVPVRPPGF